MPAGRFYCPNLLPGLVQLLPEEARHAIRVLRLRTGDSVTLFDGSGAVADGIIEQASRGSVGVRVGQVQTEGFELRHHLTIAVAMAKAHRQGFLIEKCTELGVGAIWPILAGRSVTQPGEAAVEKWSRRAIEAAKQSDRAWVPFIAPVSPFPQAVARAGEFDLSLFCDMDPSVQAVVTVLGSAKSAARILAFVGPEGGWTEEEREQARMRKLTFVSLSPTILRAETAAVAMAANVAALG